MKLLIVEDDERLCGVLRRGLAEDGHVCDVEHDGRRGEDAALAGDYDAVVLDVMLPERDGIEVVSSLRRCGDATPVLILTARDTIADAVRALDAGADDYLRKPFAFPELKARLRALGRRREASPVLELHVADLRLETTTRRVFRGDREIAVTAREYAFLEYFMRNAGLVVTRTMIEDALWDQTSETTSNIIDVYVRRLRSKLEAGGEAPLLHTVRGAGYRFGPP